MAVEQLSQIKQQLDEVCRRVQAGRNGSSSLEESVAMLIPTYLPTYFQEVQHLTNSFTALKQAQAKFQEAKNSLDDITPERACTQSIDEHKHP
jgi:hypothetical protein